MPKDKRSRSAGSAKKQPFSKYLFILFFLAILTLAILIIRPFLSTLIVSAIIAYVFYPVYDWFFRLTKMKGFSAIVLIILLLLLLSIPVVLVTGKLSKESYDVYQRVKQTFLDNGSLSSACESSEGFICRTYAFFSAFSERFNLDLGFHLARAFSSMASSAVGRASDFLLNIPGFLLHVFIGLFAMYYMFVDGRLMLDSVKRSLPLRKEHSDRIFSQFNEIIHATVYGAIVLAIVQGLMATIGYFLFGVSSPIILGMLTIIASFIPFVGSGIVWLPVSLSMVLNGFVGADDGLVWKGFGLLLYGLVFVSTIDNVLRPKIVGSRARVHPLIILLGVFGGLAMFGFAGIMVGPLLLTLFIASLKIYEQEKEYIV
ncbi:AI-2E family transporter [Candidatus Woesearchaeota archaeon]|nr:AI-2E family transporter [Candidatus Woesearchaeota archaeon]